MKKVFVSVISALFIINSEAMFSKKNKNISETKNSQNLTIYTYPKKINNLTEVQIAGDGSCGYGALLLSAYFEFLSKGYVDKASELREVAISAINNDNNPARKYLLQQTITALNVGDARANFVKFLITSTVECSDENERRNPSVERLDENERRNPSLEECIDYLEKIKGSPRITEEKDWLRFRYVCCYRDTPAELVKKILIKSNDSDNIQNVVDILETLDYVKFVRYRFELFDAIAYILGVNFCIYNKDGEVISNMNFGFESQVNIRYIERIHYNILLSDNALSCLNECGVAHKSASWGIRLFFWICDKMKKVDLRYVYDLSGPGIIKTKDEKYFLNIDKQYRDYFCTLELGIGLLKILQGHEQEGRAILHNVVTSSFNSQKRLLEKLASNDVVCNFIAKSNEISVVNKGEAINYLNELYQQEKLNKIWEIISIYSGLTTCLYGPNGNILYKSSQNNPNCDLNIKFLENGQYVNLIPVNQIKFFRDKNVLYDEYCIFKEPAFFE